MNFFESALTITSKSCLITVKNFQDFAKFTSNGTFPTSLVDSLSNPSFPLNLALNFITQNRRKRTGYSLYRRLTEAFAEGPSFKAVVSKGKANLVIVVK